LSLNTLCGFDRIALFARFFPRLSAFSLVEKAVENVDNYLLYFSADYLCKHLFPINRSRHKDKYSCEKAE